MGRPKKVEFTVVHNGACETCKNETELTKLLEKSNPDDLNENVLVFAGQPLTIERHVSFTLNGQTRRPGRPPGSSNKPTSAVSAVAAPARKKPGRPPGSKNKAGRPPGRPPGSKNKPRVKFGANTPVINALKKRGPGRPRKAKPAPNGSLATPA